MAKIRNRRGFRFIKELGGAVRRNAVSNGAQWLVAQRRIKGRTLDFGCGFGFDADFHGWDAFDPYYRPNEPTVGYDTIVCNHVLNMLTRESRRRAIEKIRQWLEPSGVAYLIVPRNIPETGKIGLRKRIQNYVLLTLPSVFADDKLEIYRLQPESEFDDVTDELEMRLERG